MHRYSLVRGLRRNFGDCGRSPICARTQFPNEHRCCEHQETGDEGMYRLVLVLFYTAMLTARAANAAEEISREQIKGLDEQIQAIKSDVLGIATELTRL